MALYYWKLCLCRWSFIHFRPIDFSIIFFIVFPYKTFFKKTSKLFIYSKTCSIYNFMKEKKYVTHIMYFFVKMGI